MRIAVLGCGAVGGVIAACLTRAGRNVTAIVSNSRIENALLTAGYRFSDLNRAPVTIPVSRLPVKTAREAGRIFDLVIAATPSTALETALRETIPYVAPDGIVITCQNGLPENRAVAVVGNRVVGCVVGWGAAMSEPGFYQQTSSGKLQIGKATPACQLPDSVAEVLGAVSPVEVVRDLSAVRWSKLAINCVTSSFGAIGGEALGTLLKSSSVRRLALEVFAEVAEVARREGVVMQPVAGTLNIAKIAINDRERRARLAPTLLLKHGLLLMIGFKFRRMRSSMLYALERGRPVEIDYLNGEIVTRGERLGVSTDVNRALAVTVRAIERKQEFSSPLTLAKLSSRLLAR
jgi:2-dehydropantoate 2-reductase